VFDVIVLGGGPAGVTAALRARELGADVALVEGGRLGGTCTNDGCVPTRALAKAARLVRDAEQLADYGLAGARPADAVDHLVFAATAADVTSVVVSGRQVVADGHHLLVDDVAAALGRAIAALDLTP